MNRRDLLKMAVAGTALGASTALGAASLPIGRGQRILRAEAASGTAFPRLFNFGSGIGGGIAALMGRWDVWGMAGTLVQNGNGTPNIPAIKDIYQLLYNLNPNAKILVYVQAIGASDYQIYSGQSIPSQWLARDSHGNQLWLGSGPLVNASDLCPWVNGQQWANGLASVLNNVFWQQGCGNGFMFDSFDLERILSYGDVDLDNNGVNDFQEHGVAWVVQHWNAGLQNLAAQCRSMMGGGAILVGNGDATTFSWSNGRTNEGWNAPMDAQSGTWNGAWPQWQAAFADYMNWNGNHYGGNYSYVGYPEHGVGLYDYQSFRFYLTTALMGDGLFAWYTAWDQYNWYDEYSVDLGTGQATQDGSGKGYLGAALGPYQVLGNGVYRRDFQNGIALCNPTGSAQTVQLEAPYQHIRGGQDPGTNNGQTVTSVTLSAGNTGAGLVGDGVILLRTGGGSGGSGGSGGGSGGSGGPGSPSVNVGVWCVGSGYTGNAATVSWTNGSSPVLFVDYSTDPNFGYFWNKWVGGATSTQLPTGFAPFTGTSAPASVDGGTTYYVRTFNGQHSPVASFTVPRCAGQAPGHTGGQVRLPSPTRVVPTGPTPMPTPSAPTRPQSKR